MIGLDHCGAMVRMLQGLPTDAEAMRRDVYLEAGPGENFLSTAHTMLNFREPYFEPGLAQQEHAVHQLRIDRRPILTAIPGRHEASGLGKVHLRVDLAEKVFAGDVTLDAVTAEQRLLRNPLRPHRSLNPSFPRTD